MVGALLVRKALRYRMFQGFPHQYMYALFVVKFEDNFKGFLTNEARIDGDRHVYEP